MKSDLETYKRLLDEERTTTRLQRQVINELQNDVQRLQTDRSNLAKFVQFKEKEHQSKLSSLQNELNQVQTYAEEVEELKRTIQEYEEGASILHEDIQDLQQRLERETMTVENLNSLIALQNRKLLELEQNPQSSSSTKNKSKSKFQPRNSFVQQTIPTILHRNYQKQPLQTTSSQQSSSIPHHSQTAAATQQHHRSPKRPLEPELAAASTSQSTLSNKKTVRNTTTATTPSSSTAANSPKRSQPSTPRREKEQSTTNTVTTTNDADSNSSSPPRAHYFEQEELGGGGGNVIDLSSIPTSLESVVNDQTSPLRTSPVRNQSENIPVIKEEEKKEVIADFTSLLSPTPRPALSDSTNNNNKVVVTSASSKGNNSKAALKTTNNANASKARHQHGAGQTCIACDKFYDTSPLMDVENNNVMLNSRDRIQLHSKHRSRNNDNRATTPPGFWDIDFTLSSQGNKK